FQAEDGIRDDLVTGVQTCALPIYVSLRDDAVERSADRAVTDVLRGHVRASRCRLDRERQRAALGGDTIVFELRDRSLLFELLVEIGRASCRERVEWWVWADVDKRR